MTEFGSEFGGKRTGRVPRMHARLFDVFHDAADDHVVPIREGIDINLGRVFEELVDQDRSAL